MSSKKILIGIVLGAIVAAGVFTATVRRPAPQPLTAMVLPVRNPLPDFSLLDQHGSPVTADVFRGQWDLLFFGFTHCPDICPTTLQVLATARRQMAESGATVLPRIVLVSVDPERDTPETLSHYVAYFGSDNLGITGNLAEIRKLTAALGIYFEKQPAADGHYNVDHSAAVLLINPAGEFHALFSGTHSAQSFVHDLPLIMAQ